MEDDRPHSGEIPALKLRDQGFIEMDVHMIPADIRAHIGRVKVDTAARISDSRPIQINGIIKIRNALFCWFRLHGLVEHGLFNRDLHLRAVFFTLRFRIKTGNGFRT